jgi:hypothetical protein
MTNQFVRSKVDLFDLEKVIKFLAPYVCGTSLKKRAKTKSLLGLPNSTQLLLTKYRR